MKKSVKIDENYYLTTQEINSDATVEVAKKTNHIFVVDVSYSMYYDLPKIKTQLKNKLSNVMRDGDTISIVWFSGSRDCGVLKEEGNIQAYNAFMDELGTRKNSEPNFQAKIQSLVNRPKGTNVKQILTYDNIADGFLGTKYQTDLTGTGGVSLDDTLVGSFFGGDYAIMSGFKIIRRANTIRMHFKLSKNAKSLVSAKTMYKRIFENVKDCD